MPKVIFLPGAGGSPMFWRPVSDQLPDNWEKVLLGWPGLGDQPHDVAINDVDDLVRYVEARIDHPVNLVAQSMGGPVAARIAIKRPDLVSRLVLVATSGGVDVKRFGASDWRPDYLETFPKASKWIVEQRAAKELLVEKILAPTLLLWGDADEISPVEVGHHLHSRIPNSRLHVLPGDHYIAATNPDQVARLIEAHLA